MAAPLSYISVDDLKRLNEFALGDSPSAQSNLAREIDRLAQENGSRGLCGAAGLLVVSGKLSDSFLETDAILDFPDFMQHPVEQASACVALLRRDVSDMPDNLRHTRADVQRRLSHLLVEYPVLLNPALIFSVKVPKDEWTTLACAIAEASFASLPTPVDGLSDRQLRLFACNKSVKAGLTRPSPGTKPRASCMEGKTPLEIACSGVGAATPPATRNATRGAFLLSLLQLSDHARNFTSRPIVPALGQAKEGDELYRALARVFWDVAITGGVHSGVTRDDLVRTLSLRSPFAKAGRDAGSDVEYDLTVATAIGAAVNHHGVLHDWLSRSIDQALFNVPLDNGPATDGIDPAEMRPRTKSLLSLLVDTSADKDLTAAAHWLARVSVGPGRSDRSATAPTCNHACAIEFMEALHEHGALVRLGALKPTSVARSKMTSAGLRLADAFDTWVKAIDVFTTAKAMEAVYAQHDTGAGSSPDASSSTPRARRRLV